MINGIKALHSSSGSGCSHVVVTDVDSTVGRGDTKKKLSWTNSTLHNRPTTCVLELVYPRRRENTRVIISVIPFGPKSFPKVCHVATSAHATFGFRHLALWELSNPASHPTEQDIELAACDVDKFISLSFQGCYDLTLVHRLSRLSVCYAPPPPNASRGGSVPQSIGGLTGEKLLGKSPFSPTAGILGETVVPTRRASSPLHHYPVMTALSAATIAATPADSSLDIRCEDIQVLGGGFGVDSTFLSKDDEGPFTGDVDLEGVEGLLAVEPVTWEEAADPEHQGDAVLSPAADPPAFGPRHDSATRQPFIRPQTKFRIEEGEDDGIEIDVAAVPPPLPGVESAVRIMSAVISPVRGQSPVKRPAVPQRQWQVDEPSALPTERQDPQSSSLRTERLDLSEGNSMRDPQQRHVTDALMLEKRSTTVRESSSETSLSRMSAVRQRGMSEAEHISIAELLANQNKKIAELETRLETELSRNKMHTASTSMCIARATSPRQCNTVNVPPVRWKNGMAPPEQEERHASSPEEPHRQSNRREVFSPDSDTPSRDTSAAQRRDTLMRLQRLLEERKAPSLPKPSHETSYQYLQPQERRRSSHPLGRGSLVAPVLQPSPHSTSRHQDVENSLRRSSPKASHMKHPMAHQRIVGTSSSDQETDEEDMDASIQVIRIDTPNPKNTPRNSPSHSRGTLKTAGTQTENNDEGIRGGVGVVQPDGDGKELKRHFGQSPHRGAAHQSQVSALDNSSTIVLSPTNVVKPHPPPIPSVGPGSGKAWTTLIVALSSMNEMGKGKVAPYDIHIAVQSMLPNWKAMLSRSVGVSDESVRKLFIELAESGVWPEMVQAVRTGQVSPDDLCGLLLHLAANDLRAWRVLLRLKRGSSHHLTQSSPAPAPAPAPSRRAPIPPNRRILDPPAPQLTGRTLTEGLSLLDNTVRPSPPKVRRPANPPPPPPSVVPASNIMSSPEAEERSPEKSRASISDYTEKDAVPEIDHDMFEALCAGAEFTKFHSTSKGNARRFIQLYAQEQLIRWRKLTDTTFSLSNILKLDDIVDIAVGISEGSFAGKYGADHRKVVKRYARCFTLYVNNGGVLRTVDLEADSDKVFEIWYFGLQSLCEKVLKARGRMLLTRTTLRSRQAQLCHLQFPE